MLIKMWLTVSRERPFVGWESKGSSLEATVESRSRARVGPSGGRETF